MESMQNYKQNIFNISNMKALQVELNLWLFIQACARMDNTVALGKKDFATSMNVTEQCIGKHLQSLVNAGMIKYKYKGYIFINPDVWYIGPTSDFETIKKEYLILKSDMAMQEIN